MCCSQPRAGWAMPGRCLLKGAGFGRSTTEVLSREVGSLGIRGIRGRNCVTFAVCEDHFGVTRSEDSEVGLSGLGGASFVP